MLLKRISHLIRRGKKGAPRVSVDPLQQNTALLLRAAVLCSPRRPSILQTASSRVSPQEMDSCDSFHPDGDTQPLCIFGPGGDYQKPYTPAIGRAER